MTGFPPGRQATAMGVAGIAMGFAPNIGPTIGGALSFSRGAGAATSSCWWSSRWHWAWRRPWRSSRRRLPDRAARLDVRPRWRFPRSGFGGVLLAFSDASSFSVAQPVRVGAARAGARCSWCCSCAGRTGWTIRSSAWRYSRRRSTGRASSRRTCPERVVHGRHAGAAPVRGGALCGGTALGRGHRALLPGTVAALALNPLAGFPDRPRGRASRWRWLQAHSWLAGRAVRPRHVLARPTRRWCPCHAVSRAVRAAWACRAWWGR